jgi:hypothetical protein
MTGGIDRAAVGFDFHNPANESPATILPNDKLTQEILGDFESGTEIKSARNL